MVAGTAIATFGRDVVVTLYGDDYRQAADVLPTLVAASIPWAVTSVYLTEARVRQRSAATVSITLALTVAILGPALVLVPNRGLDGAAFAFLAGNVVAALVAIGVHVSGRAIYQRPVEAPTTASIEADALGLAPLG